MTKILTSLLWLLIAACTTANEKQNFTVKNGNVNIAYAKKGKGDTALVFVHGWCINKEYWQKQIDHFSKKYTVVALDIGGHGESGHNRNSWTIDDFAGDVIAVIDSLRLNKVILVGHSMGGEIVLDAVSKIPGKVIGLVGIDNFKNVSSSFTQEQMQQINAFIDAMRKNYKQVAVAYSRNALFPRNYADTVSINRVLNDIRKMDSVVSIAALQSEIDFLQKETVLLSQLQLPLHLIVSDYTPVQQDSLSKYSRAGYFIKTIHGTGHYPMIEKPDEFNRLLDETIADISKGH